MNDFPTAYVTLQKTSDCYLWIVERCPLCGKRHSHGGGKLTGNPRDLLGHRWAHCADPIEPAGYYLAEREGQS